MKMVFNSYPYAEKYIDTFLDLFELAGFRIDLVDDDEGDIAIITDENAAPEIKEKQKNVLTSLRYFDII